MLRKRYQALLIKHLKEQIRKNINSDNPDEVLRILSDPIIGKAFFDDLKKEYKFQKNEQISNKRLPTSEDMLDVHPFQNFESKIIRVTI